jgi:hypothetical protein
MATSPQTIELEEVTLTRNRPHLSFFLPLIDYETDGERQSPVGCPSVNAIAPCYETRVAPERVKICLPPG